MLRTAAKYVWKGFLRGVVDVLEEAGDGHLQDGVDGFGGDLGQGLKNESSFVHKWVGDDQFLAADDQVAVKKQVDVDEAGLPFFAADAAEQLLDLQNSMKQGVRAEGGFDLGGGVEEWGRIGGAADGGVFEERRDSRHDDSIGGGEAFECCADVLLSVAEIRAKSQICRHRGGVSHESNDDWKIVTCERGGDNGGRAAQVRRLNED